MNINVEFESNDMRLDADFESNDMRLDADFGELQYVHGAGGGVDFVTDETLRLEDGVLSVNTADTVEEGNALPVTSDAVKRAIESIDMPSTSNVYVGSDEPPEDAEVWIDPEAALQADEIPNVRVEQTLGGAIITATGWDGVTTAVIKNGRTPEKGVDYFTDADKTEMVSAVIAALPVYGGETA